MHGAERQGIQVAPQLQERPSIVAGPRLASYFVPVLFPDDAAKGRTQPARENVDGETTQKQPRLPESGQGPRGVEGKDAQGRAILPENQLLIELIDTSAPSASSASTALQDRG